MTTVDLAALTALVREAVEQTLKDSAASTSTAPTTTTAGGDGDCDTGCAPRQHRPRPPEDLGFVLRDKDTTPARISEGRAGLRYLTKTAIGLRAEHAVAIDAVRSTLPEGLAAKLGAIALHSRAESHDAFLLYPNLGRRLNDASRGLLQQASHGVDVQIILADGLSAHALVLQAERLLPALVRELTAQRFTVGKPLLVTRGRIGIADEIGVLTNAKSTLIVVGERPGLGTGDSLSIYTAFRPRLDQDNAEKNCISNIRPAGLSSDAAAKACAQLLRRTFDAGGGGIHLVKPQRDVVKRTAATTGSGA